MWISELIEKILTVGGIAGVIALAITVTICYRYASFGSEPIPDILTYSLTTIIGFYFGTGVAKPATPPAAPQAQAAPVA
jgi:hypothetical protein